MNEINNFVQVFLKNNPNWADDKIAFLESLDYFCEGVIVGIWLISIGWLIGLKIAQHFHNKKEDERIAKEKETHPSNIPVMVSCHKWFLFSDIPSAIEWECFTILGGVLSFISLIFIFANCGTIGDLTNNPDVYLLERTLDIIK